MTAAGIAVDKLTIIENQLAAYEEHRTRLSLSQAEVLVEVLRLFLVDGLGLPMGDAAKRIVSGLLRAVGANEPLVVSPADSEAARTDLRERIRAELEAERKRLPAAPDALSAGGEVTADADEVQPSADGQLDPAPDEEIVEAEVVADERSIEERAAELAERVIARMAEEEAESVGFGVGVHAPRAGGFSIDDPASSTVRYGPQRWS